MIFYEKKNACERTSEHSELQFMPHSLLHKVAFGMTCRSVVISGSDSYYCEHDTCDHQDIPFYSIVWKLSRVHVYYRDPTKVQLFLLRSFI